jgi:hypothetical protein
MEDPASSLVEEFINRIAAWHDLYLGYHLKTGHTLSVQNRPTGLA